MKRSNADFLSQFMGNPARARLLRIFVMGGSEVFAEDVLAKRLRMTRASVARELAVLRGMGVLRAGKVAAALAAPASPAPKGGKRAAPSPSKVWFLDPEFPHLSPLQSFVQALSPLEHESVLKALGKAGRLSAVILSGFFVGDHSRPADILVAGERVNERQLEGAMKGLEPVFGREVRYAAFSTPEFRYRLTVQDRLIRDTLDFPHVVLLDRARML